ncbi:MAG: hypothetical protein LIO65_08170, partial [Odoribacter sp.]|nr:hypothetical protein [Odoribacter sp.]
MKKLIGCLFLYLIFSCYSDVSLLEEGLKMSGENREELEKVLKYYKQNPSDSLKYRAACFLIENMAFHYSEAGEKINWYHQKVDTLFSDTTLNVDLWRRGMDSILVELKTKKGIRRQMDIHHVSSSFLISHIDAAFKTLDYPWNRDLSFENFCEYILPYRVGSTPLVDWRREYNNTFSLAIDSLVNENTSDSSVTEYFAHLKRYMTYDTKNYKPSHLPLNLLTLRTGDCIDYTELGVYLGRTFGVPISIDFTPQWANGSNRHQWNRLIRDKGNEIAFMNAEYYPLGDSILHLERARRYANRKLAKVYRKTYSLNFESLALRGQEEAIPPFFQDPCFKDVSSECFDAVDIEEDLEIEAPVEKKFVYIMVFDNQNWQPVDWAERKKKKAVFSNMGKDVAYMAMYYHENKFYPASYPFYVDTLGIIKKLIPDLEKEQEVRLSRKFHDKVVRFRLEEVIGDKLQAANKKDFSDAVDLYVLDSIPEAKFHTILPNIDKKFSYFRYQSVPIYSDKDSTEIISDFYGNVAEIELYNEKGEKIKGDVIGTPDSLTIWGRFPASNVFDGKVLTYFETRDSIIGWAGLAFDRPETISKIIYLPRNDDNFIRENEEYELYYWNKGWLSLGKRIGDSSQELIYKRVPKNALLLLKNHTKGKEER